MASEFLKAYSEQLAYTIEELTNCAHEPIASCGAIQSVGYYINIHAATALIEAVSTNFAELLGLDPSMILGKRISDFLKLKDGLPLDFSSKEMIRHKHVTQLLVRDLAGNAIVLSANFFEEGTQVGIDLEPAVELPTFDTNRNLHSLISRLESSEELATDCLLVCEAIRSLAGFDRVMVYRFQENWDGEVIAEARDESLVPFLHLRYPAHDIPEQARKLYLRTPYRMIVDTEAVPVVVQTLSNRSRMDVSLGLSHLRASSPIHIQYLHNMGVRSSFSIPLKVNNRLWGLISCHHNQEALYFNPERRSSLELMGRLLSGRVASFIEKRRILTKRDTLEFTQSFVNNLTLGMPTRESFLASREQLMNLIRSTGAFIRVQGENIRIGSCPPDFVIEKIVEKAQVSTNFGIWKSDNLKESLDLDVSPPEAAGALMVPFSFGFDEVVIWFRKEAHQEVQWGGKPQRSTEREVRLEPRASFAAWTEKLKDCCFPWSEENEETAQFLLFNFIKGIFSKAAALSQANKELERVTRAKDEFIGMVSHELRTPLSAIIGWLDILRDSVPMVNPEVKEAVDVIERNAKLQVTLINDLLDISRIISGKLRITLKSNVRLKELVQDVIDSLKPTAQTKKIQLEFSCDDDVLVSADPDRIRQVIWNLLTNAIKFTPQSGSITIMVRRFNSFYSITVTDSGVGLSSENLKTIFDRFSQVNGGVGSRGGLGLGLSIVKSLVELHGGQIEAFSEGLGKGSRFQVQMPLFAVEFKTEQDIVVSGVSSVPAALLSGKRVLIAEDQLDTATALKFNLERMGAECVHRLDGKSALTEAAQNSFDLIISDVGMPEMNGLEFMKAWRVFEKEKGLSPVPAIALTAYATSKDRTLALESGFQSHIPKPVDKGELVAVIESLGILKK